MVMPVDEEVTPFMFETHLEMPKPPSDGSQTNKLFYSYAFVPNLAMIIMNTNRVYLPFTGIMYLFHVCLSLFSLAKHLEHFSPFLNDSMDGILNATKITSHL